MKFSTTALLSTAFIAGVFANDNLLRGRELKKETKFVADMGMYGSVEVKVIGKTIKIETELENLDEIFVGPLMAYHFHAGYVGGVGGEGFSAGNGNVCGKDFTGGHYDPTLACGKATEALTCNATITEDCCDSKGYDNCAATDSCEVGDLSGLYGNILISGGEAHEEVEDDVYKKFLADYLGDDDDFAFDTWGSIVFHDKGADGARRLCGNLVEV